MSQFSINYLILQICYGYVHHIGDLYLTPLDFSARNHRLLFFFFKKVFGMDIRLRNPKPSWAPVSLTSSVVASSSVWSHTFTFDGWISLSQGSLSSKPNTVHLCKETQALQIVNAVGWVLHKEAKALISSYSLLKPLYHLGVKTSIFRYDAEENGYISFLLSQYFYLIQDSFSQSA